MGEVENNHCKDWRESLLMNAGNTSGQTSEHLNQELLERTSVQEDPAEQHTPVQEDFAEQRNAADRSSQETLITNLGKVATGNTRNNRGTKSPRRPNRIW